MHRTALRLLGLLILTCVTTAAVAAAPLRILLTNDDGYRAPGLAAVRAALLAAGHRVTVVAPRANQSGSSVRVTAGLVRFAQVDDAVWVVDGSPADSVAVGLAHVFAQQPPDLVVSGANQGQNLGTIVNLSGTVGAAVLATLYRIPAIAVSVGIDLDEAGSEPRPFPSTLRAYPAAAALLVKVVGELAASRGDAPLLPPGALLNINYPPGPVAAFKGARIATPGSSMGFGLNYQPTGTPGELKMSLIEASPAADEPPTADTVLFAAGHATITILEGDWGADPGAREAVIGRLTAVVPAADAGQAPPPVTQEQAAEPRPSAKQPPPPGRTTAAGPAPPAANTPRQAPGDRAAAH